MSEELVLRDYQTESIQALREGLRAGHRNQILMAPTGSGKTMCAVSLLKEASRKGSRSAFLSDRISLIDQSSVVFDRYGIGHHVVQAGHWRDRSYEKVWLCSQQTLERRGFPLGFDLVIVDECHDQRKATVEYVKNCGCPVIGLSASPFAKGLADTYTNLVNVTTTDRLIADGFLVPVKMYAAKAIDMNGAKIVAGEWAETEIALRGKTIIGDIVSEWIDKTRKHFGGPVKTIVFSATVDHGDELCRQFNAAGFNFQQISYKDRSDDARRATIEEFRKADSSIQGLVSCEVFVKGFDVPDILCLAEGSRILTDTGLKPIEEVTSSDLLWDGLEFVEHDGAIFKGEQDVIEYAGLVATAGHHVKTAEGWRSFGECASKQIPIVTTGFGWMPVREAEGHFSGTDLGRAALEEKAVHSMRVLNVWSRVVRGARLVVERTSAWLRSMSQGRADAALARRARQIDEGALHQAIAPGVSGLRWERDQVLVPVGPRGSRVDQVRARNSARCSDIATGSDQQRRELRTRESSLGIKADERRQYSARRLGCFDASLQDRSSGSDVCRQDALQPAFSGNDVATDRRSLQPIFTQAKRRVWDILNAGPRNSFTCEGLLVHNCGIAARPYRKSFSSHIQQLGRVMRPAPGKEFALWLDHAGNALRFKADTDDLFANGMDKLDDGKRDSEARKEPSEQQAEAIKCVCGFILPMGAKVCPACGKERSRRSLVETVAGEMVEITKADVPEYLRDKDRAWRQICNYSAHVKRGDLERARKWALAQFHELFGEMPGAAFAVYDEMIDVRLRGKITHNMIRFARRNAKRKAA